MGGCSFRRHVLCLDLMALASRNSSTVFYYVVVPFQLGDLQPKPLDLSVARTVIMFVDAGNLVEAPRTSLRASRQASENFRRPVPSELTKLTKAPWVAFCQFCQPRP